MNQDQVESLEEVADRVMGCSLPSNHEYTERLLSDPAILEHIPAVVSLQQQVEVLREENERLQMAEHALQRAIYDDSNEYLSRIATLESYLAASEERSHYWHGEAVVAQGERRKLQDEIVSLRQGGEAVGEVVLESMGVGDAKVVRFHMYKEIPPVGTKLFTRPQPAIPPGYVQVPDWHGYALLGTGRYILNASPPPMDPDLGAEFCITLATDEDRSDNRQIGEIRDNTRTTPYQPEEIAIRIGFLTPQALDAMEAQLTILRKDHWPETISPSVPVAEKDASEYQRGFKDGYQRRDDEVMGSLA